MPRGPKDEKRPADVIGNAVHVMRIATGEIEDAFPDPGKQYARKAVSLAPSTTTPTCGTSHASAFSAVKSGRSATPKKPMRQRPSAARKGEATFGRGRRWIPTAS
jgi:hypothetical protein